MAERDFSPSELELQWLKNAQIGQQSTVTAIAKNMQNLDSLKIITELSDKNGENKSVR